MHHLKRDEKPWSLSTSKNNGRFAAPFVKRHRPLLQLAIICPSGDNWRASCANPILTLVSGLHLGRWTGSQLG
jgi:hypothetical protein